MNRRSKTVIILTAVILCLLMLASCNDNGAETEAQETSAESTTIQTTESSAATYTEAQTSDETKPDGIHAGKDSTDGWGEFNPV